MQVRDYHVVAEHRTNGDILEGDIAGVPGRGAAIREFCHGRALDPIDVTIRSCEPTSEPVDCCGYAADHRQEGVVTPADNAIVTAGPQPHDPALREETRTVAPADETELHDVGTKPASGGRRRPAKPADAAPQSSEAPVTPETPTNGGN